MLIAGLFVLIFVCAISANRINGIIVYRCAALILLYSLIITIDTLNVSIIGQLCGIGVYGGLYSITILSKIIEGFIYLTGAILLSNQIIITKQNETKLDCKNEYAIIALLTVIGGILLISCNDLISMYLSIELQSFGLYVLASLYRDSQSATYAGLKYFLLGGLSSCFILLGSALIYGSLAVTNLESISLLISENYYINKANITSLNLIKDNNYITLFYSGLVIIIAGFLFKIGAAPFYNWSIDVYDGVPTKVTIWLAIIPKIALLTFLLNLIIRVQTTNSLISVNNIQNIQILNLQSYSLTNILLLSSILSLLIGSIVGLTATRIKRLLAYSSISHIGFLLLALAINQIDSVESFIFYLISYSLTSANGFLILLAIGSLSIELESKNKDLINNKYNNDYNSEKEYSPISFIAQLKGIYFLNKPYPLLGLSFAIVLFSMAGIPPLVGFFAKQAVLLTALKNGYIFIAVIAIIVSVISAAYYLKVIKVMVFDKINNNDDNLTYAIIKEEVKDNVNKRLTVSSSFIIALLTILITLFILKPNLILNSAHIMALTIYYI